MINILFNDIPQGKNIVYALIKYFCFYFCHEEICKSNLFRFIHIKLHVTLFKEWLNSSFKKAEIFAQKRFRGIISSGGEGHIFSDQVAGEGQNILFSLWGRVTWFSSFNLKYAIPTPICNIGVSTISPDVTHHLTHLYLGGTLIIQASWKKWP